MNRLQIVQKYMGLSVKVTAPDKYSKAQILSKKIMAIQDKKIAKI